MRRRNKSFSAALFGMLLALAVSLFGTADASAQPHAWNPWCTITSLVNRTNCSGSIDIALPGGGKFTINLPPFNGVNDVPTPAPPPGVDTLYFMGVISQAGTFLPIMPSPPPPWPAPSGVSGWVRGVVIGGGCCVDVYFDRWACSVWIFPGTSPCTP